MTVENKKIIVKDLNLYYGDNHALKNVNMDIEEKAITAFIGPSPMHPVSPLF